MITRHHGDTLDILPTLAPSGVQMLATSPPYYALRSYAIPPSSWPEVVYCPLIGLPPVTVAPMVCQLGAEPDPLAYIAHLVHVLRLARPVLRDDGTLWVNVADSYATNIHTSAYGKNADYYSLNDIQGRRGGGIPDKNLLGIPQRLALALQADGWVWRSEIIWHAPNKMPESVQDRFTRAHEQVLLFAKQSRYYFDSVAVAEPVSDDRTYPTWEQRKADGEPLRRGDPSASGYTNHSAGVGGSGATRNRRDVLSIPTSPMPAHLRGADEAHYAAWPPALVEIMIKAGSANKACGRCGRAWVRQVEREASIVNLEEGVRQQRGAAGAQNGGTQKVTLGVTDQIVRRDLGPAPACACDADTARCVVLDCFGGTGTTGAVAESLGRDSILIDLGYQTLQERRTNNLQISMESLL